jgi:hypothetical protein
MDKTLQINKILEILNSFYEENKELLNLNTPIEKWSQNQILFSTNENVGGKIYFMSNEIKFEIVKKGWLGTHKYERKVQYGSNRWTFKVLKKIEWGTIGNDIKFPFESNGEKLYNKIPNLSITINKVNILFKSELEEKKRRLLQEKNEKSLKRIQLKEKQKIDKLTIFNNSINKVTSKLDKDGNGQVDLLEGDAFNTLLTKNQKIIIGIDKNYIQKFVKISLYLKNKKKNTQLIFESIKDSKNKEELNELVSLLKNQIHTYELLVFHSISMITSLVESDLITFYEIYESFDQLGVFNSNWENEVTNKLTDIGDGIKDLMYSINSMENNIVNSLGTLTYTTMDSFSELNNSITSQLNSIDSSINFNNLLTGIQTYQMYKINKNTKRLN